MSDSGSMLFDMAHGLFAEFYDAGATRRAEAGQWPDEDWARVVELGLPKALLPEKAGGFGVDPVEALGLVRIAGFHALPLPLAETMMAGWLFAQAGLPVPEGPLSVALSGPAGIIKLSKRHLAGAARRTPWGARAQALAVVTEDGHVAHVRRGQWTVLAECRNLAGEPRDDLAFDTRIDADRVAPLPDGLTSRNGRALGAAMRSLGIAGALERVLALTVTYANERVQFGRAIGKFQAVQQSLAVLAGQAAAAGGGADLAAEAVAAGLRDLLPVAVAKMRTGEAASSAAAIAHQIHGAIGFTREHALHFLTMRLWAWRDEFGNETEWARLVGAGALAAGGAGLWPMIAAAG